MRAKKNWFSVQQERLRTLSCPNTTTFILKAASSLPVTTSLRIIPFFITYYWQSWFSLVIAQIRYRISGGERLPTVIASYEQISVSTCKWLLLKIFFLVYNALTICLRQYMLIKHLKSDTLTAFVYTVTYVACNFKYRDTRENLLTILLIIDFYYTTYQSSTSNKSTRLYHYTNLECISIFVNTNLH